MQRPRDLTSIILGTISVLILISSSLWIISPFLPALLWATMIVVPTWGVHLALQKRLGGKRWAATTVMTLIMALILVVPLGAAIGTLASHVDDLVAKLKALEASGLGPPPAWLAKVPLVGDAAVATWQTVATEGFASVAPKLAPYVRTALGFFAAKAGGLGALFVQLLLTTLIAAFLYGKGEVALAGVNRFTNRLAGDRGVRAVRLAGQSIKGVALGVVVTALIQSALGGIGLAIAGVPFAMPLTLVMLVCAIAQIGPLPVLVPAVIWVFSKGDTGWGVFLAVWTLVVGLMDNVLRPILIKRGADLPLPLVISGVIGGLVAFGLIGIFIGPAVLAVASTLLDSWIDEGTAPGEGVPDEAEPKAAA